MLVIQIVALIIAIVCWSIFFHMFRKDRSRYRNCYVLFITLIATIMFIVVLPGEENIWRICFLWPWEWLYFWVR